MIGYTTVKEPFSTEIVIKKSRFIGQLYPVGSMEEAQSVLAEVKKKYWDARHNCSAMVIGERGEYTRCSDDGEPQGTAGVPMLEALKGSGLTNVLAVVTRYFGGVLLGTGGLVRAYTSAVSEACAGAPKLRYRPFALYGLDAPFKLWGKLEGSIYSLGGAIKSIDYAENIRLMLHIPPENTAKFEKMLSELSAGKLFAENLGEESVAEEV